MCKLQNVLDKWKTREEGIDKLFLILRLYFLISILPNYHGVIT